MLYMLYISVVLVYALTMSACMSVCRSQSISDDTA